LRNVSFIGQESCPTIEMPIGLTEASYYEEFPVIKINTMGFEQERILGIDQTKMYNYDKSYRQEKRQSSLFGKIFGLNEQTGTKKPFRLIADIISIKKTEKGVIIVFKEKTIEYLVESPEIRDKIYRKLNFLVGHSNREEKLSTSNRRLS
jgi:hypothetical protein